MSKNYLKTLSMSAFRGSSATYTLDFEKDRKFTLIYGENGTGKTTICDAFELLAKESVGSLDDRGMGAGLSKFWATAGKSNSEMSVTLSSVGGDCSAGFVKNKFSVTPHTAKPHIELLRRQQILKLIEAAPAKRYDEIKRFIDIVPFEASEDALRKLGAGLLAEKNAATNKEIESINNLQGLYESAGSPSGTDPVSWARVKLESPVQNLSADIDSISKLRTAYLNLIPFPDRMTRGQEAIENAQIAVAEALARRMEAASKASENANDLVTLLEAGQTYLQKHSSAECPLCLSSEKAADLAETLKNRLGQFGALQEANRAWKLQTDSLSKAEAVRLQIGVDYAQALKTFEAAISSHQWATDVILTSANPPTEIGDLSGWLVSTQSVSEAWATKEASWRDETKFVAALKSAIAGYEAGQRELRDLGDLTPRVDEALKICVAERQAFTDRIIKEIAEQVGQLYETVHPGEGLEKISLPLDPGKRASLGLNANFSGQDAPPQAYFSQSHLDTLGLCVFLALALREQPERTILILDDVLGSVDEPHVERVIQMIYSVSERFRHTIVTTHYRPWREKYRWGWLKPDQPCQFVELAPWTISDGIRAIGALPEIARLKALLTATPADPQSICSKAGVILEAVLDHLTQKYECSVPRRYGAAYTLGDLLPAIDKKLREALVAEVRHKPDGTDEPIVQRIALKHHLDELQRIAQTRNVLGAHFKTISFELLDADAVAFAQHVVHLVEALTHPEHGWPNNDKSGSYWRNSGDTRRLHPLKKPQ